MSQERDRDDGVAGAEADSPSADGTVSSEGDRTTWPERIERLEAENERLREAVAAATRRQYRFTAIGFAIVGVVALGGAVLFPSERTVLLALGGTGAFGAVLTHFLTPERFVAATVGERVYETLAGNEAAIVDDLSLQGEPTVVPTDEQAVPARLFVPIASGRLPTAAELAVPFVTGDHAGLSLEPTGAALHADLTDAAATLPETPPGIATTVGDALVEQFELIDGVEVDADADRVTMAVEGSVYGPVDRFDHPVASLLATTLAVELQCPVTPTVTEADRADWLVTCRFDSSEHG
jgi:hypothetical protein